MTAPAPAANPYRRAGRVVDGDLFIGRGRLLRQVEGYWREPGIPANVRVLGHHRTGKTSLMRRALSRLPEVRPDLVRVWIDVGRRTSGMDVFRTLANGVLTGLKEIGDHAPPGLLDALGPLNLAVQTATEWHDLETALGGFFARMHDAGQYGLLVLDEFDRAEGKLKLPEFQLLRALVSDTGCTMGLVTVSRRDIESIETDAMGGSILGGVVVNRLYVGMFDDQETDLMLARAAAVGIGLGAARPQITEYAGAHPFLLDVLCQSLVDLHQETGTLDVRMAYGEVEDTFLDQFGRLVDNIAADTGRRGGALLREIANGLPTTGAYYPDLSRLRKMGVVRVDPATGQPTLFSAEFQRYVRMSAVGA